MEYDIKGLLAQDKPGRIAFFGDRAAELFTREVQESMEGVLLQNYQRAFGTYMPGYVLASVGGRPWSNHMWTRDAGVFLRELVFWGYLNHACLLAHCLIKLVRQNDACFYTFPEYFEGIISASGQELDGTAAIVIGMVHLWMRLPDDNHFKDEIYLFLHRSSSPLQYMHSQLRFEPLLPGRGEFGAGIGTEGSYCNVVQNNLVRLALLAGAAMEEHAAQPAMAEVYRKDAGTLESRIERHFVDRGGAWMWCINAKTLQGESAVLNSLYNKGFGGLNGVASMHADVLGLEPLRTTSRMNEVCRTTFNRLLDTPPRREQLDKYGIWTQFDIHGKGLITSPSYGHSYALQTMLLHDRMDLAERALQFLADATYNPVPEYTSLHRDSRYHFYERYYSPDAVGKVDLEEGCGALNLVNVAEPVKIARLIAGIDDVRPGTVAILPRLPASWKGMEVTDWPVNTPSGIVRLHLRCERAGSGVSLELTVHGGMLPNLEIRLPEDDGFRRRCVSNVTTLKM